MTLKNHVFFLQNYFLFIYDKYYIKFPFSANIFYFHGKKIIISNIDELRKVLFAEYYEYLAEIN